jgi:hypothetical protein
MKTTSGTSWVRTAIAIVLGVTVLALLPSAAGAARCGDCDRPGDGGGSGSGTGTPGGNPVGDPTLAYYRIDWAAFSHATLTCGATTGDQKLCQNDTIDDPLPDGDHIWLAEQADATIPATQVEVVLKSGVTWWKEIKAFNSAAQPLSSVETQDSQRGPVAMRLNLADARWLVFSKAKAFGIHTGMYQLGGLDGKGGRRLTFTWASD